uniref:Uncharacterized protein n=1 Tax=Anguilla anguilla TaxID=7936 RepID=A0A0E9Q4H1_ANGAN
MKNLKMCLTAWKRRIGRKSKTCWTEHNETLLIVYIDANKTFMS